MSLVNIKEVHRQLLPSQHSQLQWAALKMEMANLEQLRQQCEDLENKNVEKLTAVLSNVEQFKKHTKNPLLKAQVAIGKYIEKNPLAWVGLVPVIMGTTYLGMIAGFAIGGPQLNIMPFIGGSVGLAGPIAMGVSCMLTAEKYEEKAKCDAHSELFRLLPELASSSNPQLNTCMKQLYDLGSDKKIPGFFWGKCLTLLRQLHLAANKLQLQQKHLEQQIEKMMERDPQADQAFEHLKSFAQRHQKFVEVNVESTQEIQKDNVKKASANAIKI